jgi:hypothetical protein
MQFKFVTGLSLAVLLGMALGVAAQQRPRASAHETVTATLGGKTVTIEYGRPNMKGREIFGGLVPYGQVWRTGADEATLLTTPSDLMIGSLHVPAGSYSLFTVPGESEWTLVVNKVAKQWGAFKYEQAQDLGRVKMKVTKLPAAVETFTIAIDAKGSNGELKLSWNKTMASVPLMMH